MYTFYYKPSIPLYIGTLTKDFQLLCNLLLSTDVEICTLMVWVKNYFSVATKHFIEIEAQNPASNCPACFKSIKLILHEIKPCRIQYTSDVTKFKKFNCKIFSNNDTSKWPNRKLTYTMSTRMQWLPPMIFQI